MAKEKNIQEYERNNVPTPGNPRFNEAWALIEVSRKIASVIQFGDLSTISDKRKLREHLRLNLRIWTIIQAELTLDGNPLPPELRQNILTLCKFIDKQTMDALIETTAEKAVSLVNINRNIAAGLLGSTTDEIAATTAPINEADGDAKSDSSNPLKIEI